MAPATSKEKIESLIKCLRSMDFKDSQTTEASFNNLTVLAREQSPAVVFDHPDCISIIQECLDKNKQFANAATASQNDQQNSINSIIACFRLISELSKMSVPRTTKLLQVFTTDYLIDLICYNETNDLLVAFQFLIQTYIDSLAGVQQKALKLKEQEKQDRDKTKTVSESLYSKVQKKVDEEMFSQNESQLFEILTRIVRRSSSYIISGLARDTLLSILLCNIDAQNLNFGVKLVEENCIQNLLDIASEVEDMKSSSSMNITAYTHQLVSAVLEKTYSCHDHDKVRDVFREKVQEYCNAKLRNQDMDDKTRAAKIFTVLLKGPVEVGNACIGQTGMVEMLIAMAGGDDPCQQKAALDTIIAATIKKDKCAAFAKYGETTLKKLRDSKNEDVRLRALVCLSKISSVGSTDAQIRPLGHEANIEFARDCRLILSRQTPELRLKHYAIEALAFLSFDGDVKEELVTDKAALDALFEQIRNHSENAPIVYSILNIFVNLTNSYHKEEKSPELVELARFAKQHVPQEHPKDSPEILKRRICQLVVTEIVSTLVMLEPNTNNERELLSRILNAMAEHEETRGRMIQQGAVKLLLKLASQGKEKRSELFVLLAAQALARLGITINPEFVYLGQKMLAAVKQLRKLLHPDCTALQNFEGLLALTNIAQASADARAHILRDNGFSQIESLMFEDHLLIRRAAVECIVNIIKEDDVIKLYEADNDRVKFLVVLCQEEDIATVKAASGALAMLSQVSEKACEKIYTAMDWEEIMIYLLTNQELDLVHRAAVIVQSLVYCENIELPKKLFESKVFEALLALTLQNGNQQISEPVSNILKDCLERAKQLNLIKKS